MATLVLPSSIDIEGIFAAKGCLPRQTRIMARPPPKKKTSPKPAAAPPTSKMPQSAAGWKRALGEVKGEYLERRYRVCANSCQNLLTGAKASATIQPAHLVYLHFYAASALEMQVRSLHHASPYRMELLRSARDHYRRASILAEAEGEDASRLISARSVSPTTSTSTSLHSPSLSVGSSVTSGASLATVDSISAPAPRVKHVTFQCGPPEIIDEPAPPQHDPYIRPDSPTLGFEDRLALSPSERHDEIIPTLDLTSTCGKGLPLPKEEAPVALEEEEDDTKADPEPFNRTRSLRRYASALTTLHRQITLVHLPATDDDAPAPPATPSNDEMRSIETKTRIERLKARGWSRKRFDPSRYEALRESALADLME